MGTEKVNYKLADEVYGTNLFLMVQCPVPGCEWSGVSKIPQSDGLNRKSMAGRPTLTWHERETILNLRSGKKSYREISRITGFSLPTIEKYIAPKEKLRDARKELRKALLEHLQEHKEARG